MSDEQSESRQEAKDLPPKAAFLTPEKVRLLVVTCARGRVVACL